MIWLLSVFVLYILALFAVSWFSLHPFRTPAFISPGAMGVAQEDVEFITKDGISIRGWWTPVEGSRRVAILAHGYMMNRCELTPLAVWLAKRGYSTLVFDFRAHGKSGGKKCGLGWYERQDLKAAMDWARSMVTGAQLILIGSSMGASACAFTVAEDSASVVGLILDSAYSRLPQAISGWWRFLGGRWLSFLLSPSILIAAPLAGFNPFLVDAAKALQKAKVPVLFVHGERDNLATPEEAKRNERASNGMGNILWMPDCGHSEGRWVHPGAYYEGISAFLQALPGPAEFFSESVS